MNNAAVDAGLNNLVKVEVPAAWANAEDKPAVVAGIKKMINAGIYPEHLWK